MDLSVDSSGGNGYTFNWILSGNMDWVANCLIYVVSEPIQMKPSNQIFVFLAGSHRLSILLLVISCGLAISGEIQMEGIFGSTNFDFNPFHPTYMHYAAISFPAELFTNTSRKPFSSASFLMARTYKCC